MAFRVTFNAATTEKQDMVGFFYGGGGFRVFFAENIPMVYGIPKWYKKVRACVLHQDGSLFGRNTSYTKTVVFIIAVGTVEFIGLIHIHRSKTFTL